MNKRKVLSILLLALITVALAVSCSSNIETPATNTEELAYVTFGNGHSRELGTSYLTEDYDNLFWFYTATKDDQYGTTGVTSTKTPVSKDTSGNHIVGLSGRVGPFSQGSWKFKLYAYKTSTKSTLVYQSDVVSVVLKGGEVKNVPVSVTTQGTYGYVKFKNAYFEWAGDSGSAKPTMEITLKSTSGSLVQDIITLNDKEDNKLKITDETSVSTKVRQGFYTANVIVYLKQEGSDTTVAIDNKGTPIFSQSFGLRVYGNATTYISGNMVEGVDTRVSFVVPEQEIKVFTPTDTGSAEIVVPVAPKGESTSTKVSFENNALSKTSVHQLEVSVTPISTADQQFEISGEDSDSTAVAGLSFKLIEVEKLSDGTTKETELVNNFGTVTVETYIAPNLSGVKVMYRNNNTGSDELIADLSEGPTETSSYDATTGRLVFQTTHFSDYYVQADAEAINNSTGTVYTSFVEAFNKAKDGQQITLKSDVCVGERLTVKNKTLTLDLAGKTISVSNGYNETTGLFLIDNNGKLIINDSSTAKTGKVDAYNGAKDEGTEECSVLSAICIYPDNGNKSELIINDGTFIGGSYAITGSGNDTAENSTLITINKGTFEARGTAIYHPQNGSLIINDGSFNAIDAAVEIRSGNLIIKKGTFTSTADDFTCNSNGNGTTTSGAAIAIAQHTTKKNISVEINGGTFNGSRALNEFNPENNPAPQVSLSITGGTFNDVVSAVDVSGFITGGTFSSDPTAYVAEGYIAEQQSSVEYKVNRLTNWIQLADTSWYKSETATEFSIGNAKQLAGLAKLVNDEKKNFSGKTVKITADINLEGLNWTPIGMSGASFQGTFDGCNYTISNMSAINNLAFGNGFFGNTIGATIKNISFENAFVSRYSDPYYYYGNVYGIVAGYAYGQTTFDNVTVKNSTIRGFGKIGAILGMAADPGNHETIFNSCTVDNVNMYGVYDVGGLAGLVQNILVVDKEKIDNKNTTVENINWVQDITEKYELLNNATVVENEINQATGKTCYLNGKAINGSYWLTDVYLYGGFAKYAVMYGTSAHDCKLQSPYGSYYLANMERVIDNLSQLETLNNPWKQQ